jgi:hypothetical protein
MRLSGPRSRPDASQKIWKGRESNPGPPDLQPETLTTAAKMEPRETRNKNVAREKFTLYLD